MIRDKYFSYCFKEIVISDEKGQHGIIITTDSELKEKQMVVINDDKFLLTFNGKKAQLTIYMNDLNNCSVGYFLDVCTSVLIAPSVGIVFGLIWLPGLYILYIVCKTSWSLEKSSGNREN